jgi:serine/threonine protein kinase
MQRCPTSVKSSLFRDHAYNDARDGARWATSEVPSGAESSDPVGPPNRPSTEIDPEEMVGEYAIEHRIGKGGMGTVYAAMHPVIGKRVAIKVIESASEFRSTPLIETDWPQSGFPPILGWSHYLALLRVHDQQARAFYEIEAAREAWSVRELERQIAALLFERLAANRSPNEVITLARQGQQISSPNDVIKDPTSSRIRSCSSSSTSRRYRRELAGAVRLRLLAHEAHGQPGHLAVGALQGPLHARN